MFKQGDIKNYKIRPTKHFVLGWMKKWGLDEQQIIKLLENSQKIDKVGKYKYEAYYKSKGKSKKLIFVLDEDYKEIIIITGAEGK